MSSSIDVPNPEVVLRVVQQSVLSLWEVVNNLTSLTPPRRECFHVTIFGSARLQPGTAEYEDVKYLAGELARLGCHIVTGGGPGLMQAANEGAAAAGQQSSIGIRIDLPFEQGANAFVGQIYQHKTFFTRLHHFVLISDAFIVVPGGIGTALETFMIWQLLQVRKLYGTPLILVGRMWEELVDWAQRNMSRRPVPLAAEVEVAIPICVPDVRSALAVVQKRHAGWQTDAPSP
jgi:uncharacterized protein (TIGR00730 family)